MEEIDIKELLKTIWMKKVFIIIAVTVGALLGYVYNTIIMTPKYEASTTIILSVDEKSGNNDGNQQSVTSESIKLSNNLMDTYTEIINSETLLSTLKENLNIST